MKTMNHQRNKLAPILFFVMFFFLFGCIISDEDRIINGANSFIKDVYVTALNDPNSYELEEMEIVSYITKEILDSLAQEYQETIDEYNQSISEVENKLEDYASEIESNELELKNADKSGQILIEIINDIINSNISIYETIKNAHLRDREEYKIIVNDIEKLTEHLEDDEIVYYKIYHQYRARNIYGGYERNNQQILYFPKTEIYTFDACLVDNSLTS